MKKTSDKLLKWEKKDYFLNALTYVLNFFALGLLFILFMFVQSKRGMYDFSQFGANGIKYFNFLILLFYL